MKRAHTLEREVQCASHKAWSRRDIEERERRRMLPTVVEDDYLPWDSTVMEGEEAEVDKRKRRQRIQRHLD